MSVLIFIACTMSGFAISRPVVSALRGLGVSL